MRSERRRTTSLKVLRGDRENYGGSGVTCGSIERDVRRSNSPDLKEVSVVVKRLTLSDLMKKTQNHI